VSASSSTAYLLVSHGSRDPRPGQALEHLAQFVRQSVTGPQGRSPLVQAADSPTRSGVMVTYARSSLSELTTRRPRSTARSHSYEVLTGQDASHQQTNISLVGTACLEATSLPLHQQVIDFSRRARAMGVTKLCIVPLFLLKGVHVMDDIPAQVKLAQEAVPDITLDICTHLGGHPGMANLLRQRLKSTDTESLLLLAHGSRRPGGNAPIQALARSLGGSAAFWSVAPHLETQVVQLMQSGVQRLAILPYFLFTGSLTDAITHATEELAERFPQLGFHLLPPLGPSQDLANLVIDLALHRVQPKGTQAMPMKRVAFRHQLHTPLVS